MSSSKRTRADSVLSWRQLYLHALGVAVRGNAQAFGFSILITVSYGVVSASTDKPLTWELVGFALSAVAAFSLLNVLVALLKNIRPDDHERERVLLVATATDFLAVGAGLAVAFAVVALTGDWIRWTLTPFLAGITYSLIQALEICLMHKGADENG